MFSTYVEMILYPPVLLISCAGVLHVCGDDPMQQRIAQQTSTCSPRMWRWSPLCGSSTEYSLVFSTYVEMILGNNIQPYLSFSVLHVCGDDPIFISSLKKRPFVFSTYVEMIPGACFLQIFAKRVLHVCGDDPTSTDIFSKQKLCSPRMWRWSC